MSRPPPAEPLHDGGDHGPDGGSGAAHRAERGPIGAIHEPGDGGGSETIEGTASRVGALGGQPVEANPRHGVRAYPTIRIHGRGPPGSRRARVTPSLPPSWALRGASLSPGLGHPWPDAGRGCAPVHEGREASPSLRPRARAHRRGPGSRAHRRGARPVDRTARGEPLRQAARAAARLPERARDARHRSSGRGRALLHLHVDHDPGHARGGARRFARGRPRSAESARRTRARGQYAGPPLRVLRGAVSSAHAPRHDHRRARGLSQRHARAGLRRDRGAHARLATHHAVGSDGAALRRSVAEHAHGGHGTRVPGRMPHRGHQSLRGPWHHPTLRVDRRALSRRPAPRSRPRAARAAWCALSRHRIRAGLPQVEEPALWRRAGARDRSRPLQARGDLPRPHRRGPAAGARHFKWRKPPYEFEWRKLPIDLLGGGPSMRRAVERGAARKALEASWRRDLARFARARRPFLLYG